MKLHQIAVTNLNSLYGEQGVNLDEDLAGASLFLIQGPTGSGKSTLMDAISLALFGTTPRLTELRSEQQVAEQVMSRGTGNAQAQVVFSKRIDGRRERYRATWMARRARERAEGTVQATVRSLEHAQPDGSWALMVSDHRAKFTKPVFDEVLEGFTPHDFQRSMLLAQGNFDAMLHAKPEERAAILERLTNTEIYQNLGARAARMNSAWKSRLEGIKAEIAAISPIGSEALAEARQQVAEITAELAKINEEHGTVVAWLHWLKQDAALIQDVEDATAQLALVRRQADDHAEALAELTEHERCAAAFAELDRRTVVEQARQRHARDLHDVEEALPTLKRAHDQASEAKRDAEAQHLAAEAALSTLREPASRAIRASEAVVAAFGELEQAKTLVTQATHKAEQAKTLVTARDAARAQAEREAAKAVAAHSALAQDHALLPIAQDLSSRCATTQQAAEDVRQREQDAEQQALSIAKRKATLSADRSAHADAHATTVDPLQKRAADAAHSLNALSPNSPPGDTLRALRDAHEASFERSAAYERAKGAVVKQQEAQTVLETLRLAADKAAATVAQAVTTLAEHDAAVSQARHDVTEHEQRLAPLERIAALGEQRAELIDHEPCPLCGSAAHPYVHDDTQRAQAEAIHVEVNKARQELAQARTSYEAVVALRTEAATTLAAHQATAKAAQSRHDEQCREVEQADEHAAALLIMAQLPVPCTTAEIDATIEAHQQRTRSIKADLAALQAAVDAASAADKAVADAIASLREADEALQAEAAGITQAERDLAQQHITLGARRDALHQRREALTAELAPFGIHADPIEAAAPIVAAKVSACERAQAEVRNRAHASEIAAQAFDSATKAAKQAQDDLAHANERVQARTGVHNDAVLEQSRAKEALQDVWRTTIALDGPDVVRPAIHSAPSELIASQQARVRQLDTQASRARDEAQRTHTAHTTATSRQATLTEASERLAAEYHTHHEALHAQLASLELSSEDALRQARLAPERVATLVQKRATLHDEQTRAQAALQTLTQSRTKHTAQRPEAMPADATAASLTPQLDELTTRKQAHTATLDEARATVQIAERDIDKRAEAEQRLEQAQRDAQVWLNLHSLIGQGDGKSFKLFAQALNLHQLLAQSNLHLARLNERYQLASEIDPATQLPTLDFIIEDTWLPGTQRSLRTLSGGESFLVSLALALGLSDLRTSSMPVETLLLDEGFGTLDPHTLDVALAALQQLQQSGRQVGIISHVAGLQESIEARVLVQPSGDGRSTVRTQLGTSAPLG